MDFAFDDAQQARFEAARSFGRRWCPEPLTGPIDREMWREAADHGVTGLSIDTRWGGGGRSAVDTARELEGLGHGAADTSPLFALGAHLLGVATPIARFGEETLKAEVLPKLTGGAWIGALAASEKGAGSDSAAIQCRAEATEDGYALTGEKTWVTNAPVADCFLVSARTSPDEGRQSASVFLVTRDTPGLSVLDPVEKIGLKGASMGTLRLEGCRVPTAHRVGQEGQGAAVFQVAMGWERGLILAPQLGAMARQLEAAITHAGSRSQFGRPIGRFQGVSHRIAKMSIRLEAARLMLYRAAWALDQEERPALYGAMAKTLVSESALQNHTDGLRIHGASGYVEAAGLGRHTLDAMGGLLHSGTTEMQYNLIAALLGL